MCKSINGGSISTISIQVKIRRGCHRNIVDQPGGRILLTKDSWKRYICFNRRLERIGQSGVVMRHSVTGSTTLERRGRWKWDE